MDQEVKIKVSSSADTSGLAKAEQDLIRLRKAAEGYDAKGMDVAAKSARSEADALEKNLTRHAKITQEAAARQALEKGTNNLLNARARQGLMTAGRQVLEGQSPVRSLGSAVGQILPAMGGAVAAIAGVVAAGIAIAVNGINSKDASDQEDKTIRNRIGAERSGDRRQQDIARSWRGSASGSIEEEFSAHERSQALKDQVPELEHAKRLSIWNPMGWKVARGLFGSERASGSVGLFGHKTAAQRAVDKNKDDQKRAEEAEKASKKSAEMQFQTEGSIELDIKRDTALHSIEGMKKKRMDKAMLSWEQEFKRVMKETNNNGLATESANLKVGEEQRQIGLQQAAGLVNARSGAGDISQAARLADQAGMGKEGWDKIDKLHAMIDSHSSKQDFSRGDLKP